MCESLVFCLSCDNLFYYYEDVYLRKFGHHFDLMTLLTFLFLCVFIKRVHVYVSATSKRPFVDMRKVTDCKARNIEIILKYR